jgi:hypothetical protein
MKRITLLTLAICTTCIAASQKVSIGIRGGMSKWLTSDLYAYTIKEPEIGDPYSNEYEIFVHYRTDKRFAVEAGNSLTSRKYKEYLRGNTWDIRHNIYEIHYSMMWRIVKFAKLYSYLGCDFSLVSDFRYENLDGIIGNTTMQEYNTEFNVGHSCLIRYQLSKCLDIQGKLSYKFDTDKLWENKSPYANSRLITLIGVGYTF